MKFEIAKDEWKKACVPHEIFLTNMAGNHILMFISALGMVGSFWQPLAMVPIVSLCVLLYTIWRAKRAQRPQSNDSWFVMCHWQIAARRSQLFITMLLMMSVVATLGWISHAYFGVMQIAALATVGGIGILPTLVTVLILIVMESDALHLAKNAQLPDSIVERFPNPGVTVIEEIDHSAPVKN
jgi:hypothetical protein